MDSVILQEQLQLRDEEEHRRRCAYIDSCTNKRERNYYSIHYGVNNSSCLLSIPNFKITECLLHDPQPDLELGVLPYVMKLLLSYLCSSCPGFSLEKFNSRVRLFPWTPEERSDVPSEIQPSHLKSCNNLKLNSQKAKNQAVRFPALAADLIPRDDPKWKNLFNLLIS